MSKLYFRYGAMNSGKSTHLMQVAHNYEERGMKVILIKPATDKKGGDKLVSRLGVERKVDILCLEKMNIYEEIQKWQEVKFKVNCILVDEVQFMTKEQVDQLFKIAVVLDIPVICYGLRTDFMMEGFEGSTRLLLLAHSIEEMKTICKCGRKAILNGRKINGEFVFEGEQVAIDNIDNVQYESLCGHCYFRHKNNK
ncbi:MULTISPECIES: thymidine kinase [Clostridium]|uniref:Thymidine kinase n=3 Tax=Clostridia TaxID=186801 RepID=A0A8I0AA84_9CLOT|nr:MULTISPECIES: thymidine kinase [Clostridia]MBC5640296.1 thymidine kinase [Clostridium lentum]MBC5654514.1 thymidine kinase [Blautia lenta]MEE0567951.1 thymidine kinase [Clostridium sp.]OKZ84942.1 MAG: thymidine kinase [Clostridium sp. 29_15]